MARETTRILGVDTSMRSSGVVVVVSDGVNHRALAHGTITNPPKRPHSECVAHIHAEILKLLDEFTPDVVAVEGVFHCRNVKTAIILGQARGAVLAACAGRSVPVFEYAPRKVKQSVVGVGSADKDQVGKMIQRLLGLDEVPQHDAADALAIALSHAHHLRVSDALDLKRI